MAYRSFKYSDNIYKLLTPKPAGLEQETKTIIQLLESDKPCMISRFGSGELQTVCLMRYWPWLNVFKNRTYKLIGNNAGFFPVDKRHLEQFYQCYKESTTMMDVLVTWRIEEVLIKDWLKGKRLVQKTTLDHFFELEQPWTQALEGKKVLVVHPFAETIESQYAECRNKLFDNPLVLPEFASLQTVKAVQSIAGNPTGYDTWFEALDWMKSEIDKKDYDIALIGCGAYGLPLAAHVKRMGKKAVHMGGILQFLFGIKSVRYEELEETKNYINHFFVYPSDKDKPKNASLVEGGCYWGK